MNPVDILLIIVLGVVLFFALRRTVRMRKSGGCGCSGGGCGCGCPGCSGGASCPSKGGKNSPHPPK